MARTITAVPLSAHLVAYGGLISRHHQLKGLTHVPIFPRLAFCLKEDDVCPHSHQLRRESLSHARSLPSQVALGWGHGRMRQLLPVETQVNSTGKRQVNQKGLRWLSGTEPHSAVVVAALIPKTFRQLCRSRTNRQNEAA